MCASLAHFKNINSNCVIEKNIAMLSLFQMPSTHTAQAPMLPTINNGQRALSFPPARTLSAVCVCVCAFVTALMGISMSL